MSNMIESLAQNRHAERYQGAQFAAARGETPGRLRSTRTRAGWLLVGLGLRLALPGRQDAARRITLIGR
jgi:hypothetical protein